MAKTGRPKITIDERQFETLCRIHCTLEEIALVNNCSEDTIERWCKETYKNENGEPMTFSEVYQKFSAEGKSSLRRWQIRSAENGNTAMLIWLGKQYLGQKETQDIQITNNVAQEKFAEVLDIWKQGCDDEVGE